MLEGNSVGEYLRYTVVSEDTGDTYSPFLYLYCKAQPLTPIDCFSSPLAPLSHRFFVGEGFIAFATSHLGHGLKIQAHLHQTRILLKIQMIMSQ